MNRSPGSFRYKYQTHRRQTFSANRILEQESNIKAMPIENYDKEYVINFIIPLLGFINNYGSITGKMNSEARSDQIEKCEQKFNQSASSKANEPKSKANKTNECSSLLPQLKTVDQNTNNILQTNNETSMDIRRIEQMETNEPSEETLQLTNKLVRVARSTIHKDITEQK